MRDRSLSGSLIVMRFWLIVVVGLTVTGCSLSDEPIPAGPIEIGPLPGEITDELALESSQSPDVPSLPTLPYPERVVAGKVRNGTDDASIPSGLKIELRGVMVEETGSAKEFLSRTVEIAQDGTFRFEDVPFDVPSSAYIVRVIYDGVEFADGAIVDSGKPALDLSPVIYEHTTDPAVLNVDAMYLILNQHPNALLVTEVMVLSNASDRVYVSPQPIAGGRRGSILIPVPGDAYGLSFDGGELGGRFIVSDGHVYDTRQVLPGEESHMITANYVLPFSETRQISFPITYPTHVVTVLAEEEIKVTSLVLTDGGSQVIQGQAFLKYQAYNLTAGQSLDLQIEPASGWISTLRFFLAGLIILLAIASLFYGWLFVRGHGKLRGKHTDRFAISLGPEHQGLIGQIAALDESFEAGKLNRFEWEAQRAELKAKLAEKAE
ncbi:MAG: hypothetical protein JXB07_05130 [Anaerolineae bacterium]|nr:hypothetical protein [Anaerolineae bacterium]